MTTTPYTENLISSTNTTPGTQKTSIEMMRLQNQITELTTQLEIQTLRTQASETLAIERLARITDLQTAHIALTGAKRELTDPPPKKNVDGGKLDFTAKEYQT